ncbi:hypothetical protein G7Y89_g7919 [Cudoniella acicularis]|uniref:Uncharacterized protein n=1 Tax=Cudoniella acicularis TaxID=354080 RepID=A0A8H4W131_9HELO|nr:hypothetical protein G7Y89_g7919 [Cudoniella acicularis]
MTSIATELVEYNPGASPDVEAMIPIATEPDNNIQWHITPRSKLFFIPISKYCTFRAVTAVAITLQAYLSERTSLASPCLLLFALMSTQMVPMNLNFALPRQIRLLLTFDILILFIIFLVTPLIPANIHGHKIPSYAYITTIGGNSPVYASDCYKQASHWNDFGCGNWAPLSHSYTSVMSNPMPPTGYYPPYASTHGVNDI